MNKLFRPGPLLLLSSLSVLAAGGCGESGKAPEQPTNPLLYPKRLTETAPSTFRARFETSAGEFVIQVHRDWAPRGADRFYNLVKNGYYDDQRIYRVVDGFIAQWGIHGVPLVDYQWHDELLLDDPVKVSNTRGRVTFAKGGANSRTTEVFINLKDNPDLDERGFAPFGEVVDGMEVVDAFYAGYGDGPPRGEGPYQAQAHAQGNEYFDAEYPELTRILRASVETP
ncbi:MAG: peptidylprolyl isomerase [Gemmatimonadota bacterium]